MPLTVLPAVALVALGTCGPTPWVSAAAPAAYGAGWVTPVGPPAAVLRTFAPPPPAAPWLPGHRGVDLAVAPGQPVRADGAGVVAFAGSVAGTPVAVVDHGGGLRSTFEPVDAAVRVGARVQAGDLLGHAGAWWSLAPDMATDEGAASLHDHCAGSCLHWGMLRDGAYVDPLTVTGLRAGCAVVRLLPVDGQDAARADLTGWSVAGAVPGERRPGTPSAGPAPPGGHGPGGAAAVAGESAAAVAVAAAAVGVTVRRRRRALLPPPGGP